MYSLWLGYITEICNNVDIMNSHITADKYVSWYQMLPFHAMSMLHIIMLYLTRYIQYITYIYISTYIHIYTTHIYITYIYNIYKIIYLSSYMYMLFKDSIVRLHIYISRSIYIFIFVSLYKTI